MTRLALIFLLLSGCAAPQGALPSRPAARPLAEVNEDLRDAVVQIEFADGTSVDRAERVRVDSVATIYTADGIDGATRRSVPTADIVRIVVVSERAGSPGGGAIVGAMPGLLMAFGSAFVRPDADAGPTERFDTRLGAMVGFYGGLTLALVGGVFGAAVTGRGGPARHTVVYEGPVGRYLSAQDLPVTAPPNQ